MANPEHLAKLKKGREAWNAWNGLRSSTDLRGAKLDELDLSGFYLRNVDLSEASLRNAVLGRTELFACNAERAVFTGAEVLSTVFLRCLFGATSFQGVTFFDTHFSFSDLTDADLSDALLALTTFTNSKLIRVKGVDTIKAHNVSIGIDTFFASGGLPESLLRLANLPEEFITYAASLAGHPIEYYSCFLSYSSKDDDFARRLHADLQAKKIKTWFAPEDLKIGDRFRARIDESIRIHDKLVLVLSAHSIDSPWVRREVEAALDREDREKKDVLFPITLDDAVFESNEHWAREVRRSRHIGDFRNWKSHDDYTVALDRLVRDLKKEGPIVMRTMAGQ